MDEKKNEVKAEEFFVHLQDNEVSLRSLSGGRVIFMGWEKFGTVEIVGERAGVPSWITDGLEVDVRHEITLRSGETMNIWHPGFRIKLTDSASRP